MTIVLALQLAAAAEKIINSQLQCLLIMKVFPLEFIEKTQTMQTKVYFESNCMPYIHTQYFVIPWDTFLKSISLEKHPKTMMLVVRGQNIRITFSDPEDEPDKKWVYRKYMTAKVEPNNFQGEPVNLKALNGFLIANKGNKKKPFFKKKALETLWNSENPCNMTVQGSLAELVAVLIKGEQVVKAY